MDERLRFVANLLDGESMTDVCREGQQHHPRRPASARVGARAGRHDRDVVITACGRICMHRKRINLSHVLAGQRVGIQEVDDGIRIVSFMQYDLGFFDHETCRLEPVGNPFEPKVLPMSPV